MGRNKSFEVIYIGIMHIFSAKYVWTFEFLNSGSRTFYIFSHVWVMGHGNMSWVWLRVKGSYDMGLTHG